MTTTTHSVDSASRELLSAIRMWRLWGAMGWDDIRARYRGSVFGPSWVAGGIAATSLGAGLLYSRVIKVDANQLVPFISISITLWTLIALTLTESCHAFVGSSLLIRNTALPRPIHVLRTLARNLIVFAHGLVVVAIVFILYRRPIGLEALWAIPGLLLLLTNLIWASWLLAILSARFRDVIQLVAYGLQFAIFVTPIFWFPELAGHRFVGVEINPFYHLLAVVREPILGRMPEPESWDLGVMMAVVGSALAFFSFARHRHNVVLWS